ncbi:MAG: cytochrome b [Janthinobacterium lividum]
MLKSTTTGDTFALQARYTRTAVILHWLIAGLIFVNIALGFVAGHSADPLHRNALNFHKPIGLCVLGLSLVRLSWRLTHKPPRLRIRLANWERLLSNAAHVSFYGLMIALPMTGWLLSSAVPKRHPIEIPGIVIFPFLPVAASASTAKLADGAHVTLAYFAVVTILLHIAGVVKHQVVDRHDILTRMRLRKRGGVGPMRSSDVGHER